MTSAVVCCVLAGSMGAARATDAVQVPAGFTITGSGSGHGVGMSQYGAQGMGLDGFTAAQILTHYYTGTTVDAVALPNADIRVGLLQDRKFVAVRGEPVPDLATGLTQSGARGFKIKIDAGAEIAIAPGMAATFTTVNGLTEVSSNAAMLGTGTIVTLSWEMSDTAINLGWGTSPAAAVNDNDPKTTNDLGATTCITNSCSHRYRYGTLEITSGTFDDTVADLAVVNTLRLSDEYLWGLGEVPSSWTDAAMQAQAIAARSYAVRKTSTRSGCNCQIYATTLDQAFVGYSKEIATSGNLWKAAVNATIVDPNTPTSPAYVVRYKGSVISTYYSSSTGGKSQPTSEVWGSAFPYLVSVDDHWSQDPRVHNSNSAWTDTVDQASLIKQLHAQGILIPDVWSMTVTGNYPSGGISKLNLSDSAGNITSLTIAPNQPITPDELRGVLGTKSTYISAITSGVATIAGSTSATAKTLTSVTKINWPTNSIKPVDFKFTGRISPAQLGVTIKLQKRSGGDWKSISAATTNIKGSWSILWPAPVPGNHDLRIVATNSKGTIKTSTNRVKVAGSITISSPKSAKRKSTFTVSGGVSPAFAGVAVIVERKIANGTWKQVAKVTTDSSGKWVASRSAGTNKLAVSYRAKTSDARLGVLISNTKTTKVN